MPNVVDFFPCYPITVSLDFGTIVADPMMIMVAGQELIDTVSELYPETFIGGCGRLKDHNMTLFFNTRDAAQDLRDQWYIARAKVLAELARHRYGVDPDDIPF